MRVVDLMDTMTVAEKAQLLSDTFMQGFFRSDIEHWLLSSASPELGYSVGTKNRVPSKEEWVRRYGTPKQIAGFEKRSGVPCECSKLSE